MKTIILLAISLFFAIVGMAQTIPNPIMFCTQIPHPQDFRTLMSTFANHEGRIQSVPRGGDLYIRYPNGNLKNLTQLAGYGETGLQAENAIAVRDPHIHWNGTKALFSMIVGAPPRFQNIDYFWQIYEVTGLGENDTPIITKIPNQPENYNNVSPIYGTDGRIIFVSDRPRGGQEHLYPQHDEYESTPIVTGLWRIDPDACSGVESLEMLTHAPSGDFTPIIDSFGRLIFTRWDHLQRDQLADSDIITGNDDRTFNYSDETADATTSSISLDIEVFPEPRGIRTDLFAQPEWQNVNPHTINLFHPWMMREDGTALETVNHIGRHELAGDYFLPNFNDDDNLSDFYSQLSANPHPVSRVLHLEESPLTSGLYYGTQPPEFGTHASGGIISMYIPEGLSAEDMVLTYITHPDTQLPSASPSSNHSGLYRNPIPLSNGEILVMHTSETRTDANMGTSTAPQSRYDYRLQLLTPTGAYFEADGNYLTGAGISKSVSWYNPNTELSYDGLLWETFPVEVVARPMPSQSTLTEEELPSPEQSLFDNANIDVADFKMFLKRNQLALAITRNVTSRDDEDIQQPFNLKVVDSNTQTVNPNSDDPNKIYEVEYLQYLQGDQLRGTGGMDSPASGRRVIAQYLHDNTAMTYNLPTSGLQGSINLGNDGSVAAILPANRALTWQLTDATNKPIVRERIWMSFVSGEIRVCGSCHGENDLNQASDLPPENAPEVLANLLNHVKTIDSDNDGTFDIYDFYPSDNSRQIGEAVNEDFTNALSNWLVENEDGDAIAWQPETDENCHGTAAGIDNRLTNNIGTIDRLSQFVDLTLFRKASLQFEVAYARYDATFYDGLKVKAVSCDGQTETMLFDKAGATLATVPDQMTTFVPTSCENWRRECVDISAFVGQRFQLVFENTSGFGNKLYLDNIKITEQNENEVCGQVLAIDNLISFDVKVISPTLVKSNWKAKNEANIKSYRLERSKDGRHFETISELPKQNNYLTINHYQFLDKQPFWESSYYRLSAIQTNDQVEYSNIQEVYIATPDSFILNVSPTLFTDQLQVYLDSPQMENIHGQVIDSNGRKIQNFELESNQVKWINTEGWQNGIYFIQIHSNHQCISRKIIKN